MGSSVSKDPPIEEPQEMMIMCNVSEIFQMLLKKSVIIWHDPNVNSPENIVYINQLQDIIEVIPFTDSTEAALYVMNLEIPCQLLTSGANGFEFIQATVNNPNVMAAYIFCRSPEIHVQWALNFPKIRCIVDEFEDLKPQIQLAMSSWYKKSPSLRRELPHFSPIFFETDTYTKNNMFFYFKGFLNFSNREQAKQDFLRLAKLLVEDEEDLKKFENDYNAYDMKLIFNLYTQMSSLYILTKNCLHIASADSILYARLIIRDLETAIKEYYHEKSKDFNGTLYLADYISNEKWSEFEANTGKEIEAFSFISATKKKSLAVESALKNYAEKMLITIIVPAVSDQEGQGFAEMDAFSDFPNEEAVLFNIRSKFAILEARTDKAYGQSLRQLVLLYDPQAMRRNITLCKPVTEIKIKELNLKACGECTGKLEGIHGGKDALLFVDLSNKKKFYTCLKCANEVNDRNKPPYLCLLSSNIAYDYEANSVISVQGKVMEYKEDLGIPFYGSRCINCPKSDEYVQHHQFRCLNCPKGTKLWCMKCFDETNLCIKIKHNVILEYQPFTFWSEEMSGQERGLLNYQNELTTGPVPFEQPDAYYYAEEYPKAKLYCEEYLKRNEGKYDQHIADVHEKLGLIEHKLGSYQKALEHHSHALRIRELELGGSHPKIAVSYNNLGIVNENLRDFQGAKEDHTKALHIRRESFGEQNLETATSYNNLASAVLRLGDKQEAETLYTKALKIRRLFHEKWHVDTASSYESTGLIYEELNKHDEAIKLLKEAVEIRIVLYGEQHSSTKFSYNNLASAYARGHEYNKASEIFERARKREM